MILVDSNLVIYGASPANHPLLRAFFTTNNTGVSAVTLVETLGFHGLEETERTALERFFASVEIFPIDTAVVDEAVRLRRQRRMSLGDALIGATAVVNGLPLATRNVADFRWIPGLEILNPMDQ